MEYWVYWDDNKPHASVTIKRVTLMEKKPTENQIHQKRRQDFKPRLSVKKIKIEVLNDKQ